MNGRIVAELQQYERPLHDARPHPDNTRKHRLDKIAQSLKAHGQRSLVVVQSSTGRIVKGNGTWAAARELGWQTLAMNFQEMDDSQALDFLIADNRTSDLAGHDQQKLAQILRRMADDTGITGTLWEDEELADLEEELDQLRTLVGTASGAAYAELDPEFEAKARERAEQHREGGRLNEVPLRFTKADYALFVLSVQRLRKIYGTSGTIDTVFEAVKRQAQAEETAITGGAASHSVVSRAVRDAMVELRLVITTMSIPHFNRTMVLAAIDEATPSVIIQDRVVEPDTMPLFPDANVPSTFQDGQP